MPACIEREGSKWRVVECDTRTIVKNAAGTAVDGGGHSSRDNAISQAAAINRRQEK